MLEIVIKPFRNCHQVIELDIYKVARLSRNINICSFTDNKEKEKRLILYFRKNWAGTAGRFEGGIIYGPGPKFLGSNWEDFPIEMLRAFSPIEDICCDVAYLYYDELIRKYSFKF